MADAGLLLLPLDQVMRAPSRATGIREHAGERTNRTGAEKEDTR
jgi:hypothetical protein